MLLVSTCIYSFSVHSVSEPWPGHIKCSFSEKLSPAADSSLAGIQFILLFSKGFYVIDFQEHSPQRAILVVETQPYPSFPWENFVSHLPLTGICYNNFVRGEWTTVYKVGRESHCSRITLASTAEQLSGSQCVE